MANERLDFVTLELLDAKLRRETPLEEVELRALEARKES